MTAEPTVWLGPIDDQLRAKLWPLLAHVWDTGWANGANDAYDDTAGREREHTVSPNPYRTEETTK